MAGFLLYPPSMEEHKWEAVTKARLIGFGAGLGLFLVVLFRSEPGFVFLLDYANLLFHEAGHPAVGIDRKSVV